MTDRRDAARSGNPADLRAGAEVKSRDAVSHARASREPSSQEETARLNHELQIHQIELEMQNEDLRRAQAELEASRTRYFELYDLAPVGYLTVSDKGIILEANLTAATMLGVERRAMLARPLASFVVPEDQDVLLQQTRLVFTLEELVVWEMRLSRAEDQPFPALLEATVRPDVVTGQSVCGLVISDITGRRKIEQELQESEERYRVIVESSRDLIFFLDLQGKLRWENQAARDHVAAVAADGDHFRRVHPADAAHVADTWRAALSGDVLSPKITWRLRAADGGYRTLESVFRKITYSGEQIWCVVSTDMTEVAKLRRRVSAQAGIAGMVGRDPKMLELAVSVKELADEDVPVLILGESGTGKELIASAIHREGRRAAENFVAVNCGAIPDTLLETELFGHVKGSFTGAHRDNKGRFELAHGGSIFLDEVGELSLAMQVKLLRVLQDGTFEKVGAEKSSAVDVRVISATNKDLRREVAAGRFREDLYYRLSVVPLTVPPLRERMADLPLLAAHIIEEEARRSDRRHDPARPPREVVLDREALLLLLAHRWPGNIRELQNVLRYALIKCKGTVLRPLHLPPSYAQPSHGCPSGKGRKPKISTEAAAQALKEAGGHPGAAALSLGVSRATLYRHLPKECK